MRIASEGVRVSLNLSVIILLSLRDVLSLSEESCLIFPSGCGYSRSLDLGPLSCLTSFSEESLRVRSSYLFLSSCLDILFFSFSGESPLNLSSRLALSSCFALSSYWLTLSSRRALSSDLCLSSCFDLSLLSSYLNLSSFLRSRFNSALDVFDGGTSTEPRWFVEHDVVAEVAVVDWACLSLECTVSHTFQFTIFNYHVYRHVCYYVYIHEDYKVYMHDIYCVYKPSLCVPEPSSRKPCGISPMEDQRVDQRDVGGSTRGTLAGHQRGTGGALAGTEWGDERGDGCPKLR